MADMQWLIGHGQASWVVAVKAVLLYAVGLGGLRMGTRRTLAQMSVFDFVTAVAMGAAIGRTATAATTSFATGAVAVATLIAVHRLVAFLRGWPPVARVTDHRVRVLVAHGRIQPRQLRLCGLTRDDLTAALRQHGHTRLADVGYVLYEHAGGLTVVANQPGAAAGDLIAPELSARQTRARGAPGQQP